MVDQNPWAVSGPPAAAQSQLRELLGPRYEVLGLIGSGASAAVYKVADRCEDGEVKAAKVVQVAGGRAQASELEPLRTEFLLGCRFAHPNLARCFDFHSSPEHGLAALTMEFVEGQPLSAGATGGDLDLTCGCVVELLRGLQFLHDSGYVHGDVKPSNVLWRTLGGSARVKLLDYHLTFRPAEAERSVSRGTLRYMAPEVIAGEAPDGRSDLYSAGVVFYEALSGRALFEGTAVEVAAQHLTAPVEVQGNSDEARVAVARVIERLLAKRPEARYDRASEAILAIAEALGHKIPTETTETLLGRVRSAPVVAREGVLKRLDRLVDNQLKLDRSAAVVVVQGQPGIGKTRLLRELEVRAQSAGLLTVRLSGSRGAHGIVARLEETLGPGASKSSSQGAAAGSGHEDVGFLPRPDLGHIPAALLARLERAGEGLSETARARPTLLVIDDADGSEPGSSQALLYLLRVAERCGVLSCLALEAGGGPGDSHEAWLDDLRPRVIVEDVRLDELSVEETRRLLREMLPSEAPEAALERLLATCGGLPEVLAATVEHLASAGCLSADRAGLLRVPEGLWDSLPGGLQSLHVQVMGSADDKTRSALELLAISAQEMRADDLGRALDLEQEDLVDILRRGTAEGLISLRETTTGVLCKFQHRSFATAVLETLPPERVRELHDRYAGALEGAGATLTADRAMDVALHRLKGASPQGAVELVLRTLSRWQAEGIEQGATEAIRLALDYASGVERLHLLELGGDLRYHGGAPDEAVGFFQQALECGAVTPADRRRLIPKLATAWSHTGSHAEAERVLLGLLQSEGEGAEADGTLGRVWLSLAITRFYQWKYDDAARDCTRAIECGERSGDRGLVASARKWLGTAYLTSGAVDRAYETLEQALREARETKDTAGIGHVLASLGRAAMLKGDTERARAYLEEALSGLRAGGWLSEAARTLSNLGAIEYILCRWDEAAGRYTEALSLYQGLGFKAGSAAMLINLSDNSQSQGWLEKALRQGREAISCGAEDPRWRCHGMLCVARAEYALGDLQSARRDAEAALQVSETARLQGPTEVAERLLGEISLLQGRPAAAREHLQRALAYNEKRGSRRWQAVCRARLAEVEMADGDLQAAAILAQSACEVVLDEPAEGALALARSVRGRLRLRQGQPEEALSDLLAAEQFFSSGRIHDELTELALQIGKANLQLGRLRFAALYFRTALDAVEQVAGRLESESNRKVFLSDPRRQEVFAAVRALRAAAESAVPDAMSGGEQK